MNYYLKAAEMGNCDAMLDLGGLYLTGKYVKKDREAAFNWYKKAYNIAKKDWYQYGYDDSLSNISFRLAKCFHYGLGTSRNISLASLYIDIAYKECMYWKKYNNKFNLVEIRAIKKERHKIECDKHGTPIENLKKGIC